MIADKTTPTLRKRFRQEIQKTKETDTERGFFLCVEKGGKLSAGDSCTGDECSINITKECNGKKIQGNFHTHPYLASIKKQYGLTNMKPSPELMRSTIETVLEFNNATPTNPSYGDLLSAMSGKCSTKTNGTTCIGTDIDENNVECWTTRNDIDAGDCVRSWMENMDATHNILPKEWIKRLFDKEIISLGGKNRR